MANFNLHPVTTTGQGTAVLLVSLLEQLGKTADSGAVWIILQNHTNIFWVPRRFPCFNITIGVAD